MTSHQKIVPIVGARFRPPAPVLLAALPLGTKLRLEREPENAYDSNAVKVLWDLVDDEDWLKNERTLEELTAQAWTPARVLEFYAGLPAFLGFIPNGEKTGGKIADVVSPGLLSGEVSPEGTLATTLSGLPGITLTITPHNPPERA